LNFFFFFLSFLFQKIFTSFIRLLKHTRTEEKKKKTAT
jgi:hypothetical protein